MARLRYQLNACGLIYRTPWFRKNATFQDGNYLEATAKGEPRHYWQNGEIREDKERHSAVGAWYEAMEY